MKSLALFGLFLLFSLSASAQELNCFVQEEMKPYFSFHVKMKDSERHRLDCDAQLTVEESDAYIGTKFKEVVAATYRQTTGCVIKQNEIAMNWADGDLATLIVQKQSNGNYIGTIDFPYGVDGVSILSDSSFSIQCSSGGLRF